MLSPTDCCAQEEQIALRKMEEEHRRRDKLRLQKERARDLTRGIKQKMKLQVSGVRLGIGSLSVNELVTYSPKRNNKSEICRVE